MIYLIAKQAQLGYFMSRLKKTISRRIGPTYKGIALLIGPFDSNCIDIRDWAYDFAKINVMGVSFSSETIKWLEGLEIEFDFAVVDLDHFDTIDRCIDLCLLVRRLQPDCKIILVSEDVSRDDFGSERKPIADATLQKPVSRTRFLDTLLFIGPYDEIEESNQASYRSAREAYDLSDQSFP